MPTSVSFLFQTWLQRVGDFTVRYADNGDCLELILSVRGFECRIAHITLLCSRDTKRWSLTSSNAVNWSLTTCSLIPLIQPEFEAFETVVELIKHYAKCPLPPAAEGLVLVSPCERPRWIIKRADIEFGGSPLGKLNFVDRND